MAVKDAPSRSTFLCLILDDDTSEEELESKEPSLMKQLESYVTALNVIVKIIHDFYVKHDLNSEQQI